MCGNHGLRWGQPADGETLSAAAQLRSAAPSARTEGARAKDPDASGGGAAGQEFIKTKEREADYQPMLTEITNLCDTLNDECKKAAKL
jgi:hypothetical protein